MMIPDDIVDRCLEAYNGAWLSQHENMQLALQIAYDAGRNKERELFGRLLITIGEKTLDRKGFGVSITSTDQETDNG
jgi:hypothetical protein